MILEKSKEIENVDSLKEEIRRLIRSSVGTRAKEDLIIKFIDHQDVSSLSKDEDILSMFYSYAKKEKEAAIKSLIEENNLKGESDRYIRRSIEKGQVSSVGGDLDSILPATSRRAGAREAKKQMILEKIEKIVKIFIGI